MKKWIVLIASVLFYAFMLVLTFTARGLHEASLPWVKVTTIGTHTFTDENGEQVYSIALPKDIYDSRTIYQVTTDIVNGEWRQVAHLLNPDQVQVGLSDYGYYEILKGLYYYNLIITDGLEGLTDGCEVYIENEY